MRIEDLKVLQNFLDESIFDKFEENRVSTHDCRVIALDIEIHELINETKFFKYWSNLQAIPQKSKMIEEYIDCLHFMLSLGIDYDIVVNPPMANYNLTWDDVYYSNKFKIAECLNTLLVHKDFDVRKRKLVQLFDLINDFGGLLCLSEKEIIEEYKKKWLINLERQQKDY